MRVRVRVSVCVLDGEGRNVYASKAVNHFRRIIE